MHKINIRNGKPNAIHKRVRDRAAVKKLRTFLRYSYDDQWRSLSNHSPLRFFEHSGQYVISKKAELWSAENEEFLYLVNIPL